MKKILLVALLIATLCGCGQKPIAGTSNTIFVILPYRHAGTWVFDDASRGLTKEPFVAGMPGIIDKLVEEEDIPNADKGFRLLFSAWPFPGYTHTLVWKRKEAGGNWYACPQLKMEGWLCPALFKFFREAPKVIYFKAEKK